MAFIIKKVTVDGVTMTGCYQTGDNQETALEGVSEATILVAPDNTETVVASPTTSPSPGPSRAGIELKALGKMERCAVCGLVFHKRQMRPQRGGWVCKDDYDEKIPIRGRTGQVPARRDRSFGAW